MVKRRLALAVAVFLLSVAGASAQSLTLRLVPEKTTVSFSLEATAHTVHGSFKLKQGNVHWDPSTGVATGDITVDAASGETGNDSRDHKMHKEVLESEKYPAFVFSPTRVSGALPQGPSTVQVQGVLRIHGQDHALDVTIPITRTGDTIAAALEFEVPYVSWGMKNPSNFLLHVSDKVQVVIKAEGVVAAAGP